MTVTYRGDDRDAVEQRASKRPLLGVREVIIGPVLDAVDQLLLKLQKHVTRHACPVLLDKNVYK